MRYPRPVFRRWRWGVKREERLLRMAHVLPHILVPSLRYHPTHQRRGEWYPVTGF
jgi:hypothetical protein